MNLSAKMHCRLASAEVSAPTNCWERVAAWCGPEPCHEPARSASTLFSQHFRSTNSISSFETIPHRL